MIPVQIRIDVEVGVSLLVWVVAGEKTKLRLYSILVEIEVWVEVELGNKLPNTVDIME